MIYLVIYIHFPSPVIYLENKNKLRSGKSQTIFLLVLGVAIKGDMRSPTQSPPYHLPSSYGLRNFWRNHIKQKEEACTFLAIGLSIPYEES